MRQFRHGGVVVSVEGGVGGFLVVLAVVVCACWCADLYEAKGLTEKDIETKTLKIY